MTDLNAEAVAPENVPTARVRVLWDPWTVAALALGILAIAVGWLETVAWLYVAGLLLAAGALAVALRRTWWLAALVAAAIGVVGLGVPWLTIQRAYAVPGVAVDAEVQRGSSPIPSDDGLYRVVDGATVTALRPDGTTAWQTELDETPGQIVPLTDGRALITGARKVGLLAADGSVPWSTVQRAETTEAGSGDVLVRRGCVDADKTCTWTGIDVSDGSTVWTAQGGLPRAFVPVGRGYPAGDDPFVEPVTTELFGLGTAGGTTQILTAATGEVVRELPVGQSAWLVGDLVLAVDVDACTIDAFRGDESLWSASVDCRLAQQFEPADSQFGLAGGLVSGDGLWTDPRAGFPTFVVDLRSGAVRETETYDTLSSGSGSGSDADQVVGAGVVAERGADEITVRSSADGAVLWSTPFTDGDRRSVQADGTLVVLDRPVRPLLLHEWFAPSDDRYEISVRDSATGEVRATMRHDSRGATVVGDRVLVTYSQENGKVGGRMIGG